MAKKFLVPIDLVKNELQNARIQNLASDPSSPVVGQFYFNTGSNKIRSFNGSTWDEYGTSTASGTVTGVSVVSANGFAGTVANSTTTPAITLTTSITGVLKGNGTAISAATSGTDYAPGTSGNTTGLVKSTTGTGALTTAAAGTDYEVPLTFSTGLTRSTNTITVNTSQNISTLSNLTSNGLIKTSGGTGALSVAAAGTDYLTPTGNGSALTGITVSQVSGAAPLASPTFTGTVTVPTPVNSTDAASKGYVDTAVQGLDVKNSVVAATVGTETFTVTSGTVTQIAGTTLDGVSPAVGDRILIKDAPASTGTGSAFSTQPGNGIYTVTNATTNLTVSRSTDQSGTNNPQGDFVFVDGGTVSGSNGYVVTVPSTTGSFTYGTNNIKWSQFSGAGQITAGTGLAKSGNTISIENSGVLLVTHGGTGTTTSTGTGSVVLSNSPTLVTPALGTPASGVATNLTGTAAGLTAGTVTTNANLTGDVTSSGNATTYNNVVPATKGGAGTITGILKANGSGTVSAAVSGTDYVVPSGSITGNANTATALQTARNINGVSFNGTGNITVPNATRFTQTIGDGTTTAIAVTHSLGQQYVLAQVFDATSNVQVECDITLTSSSVTTFTFTTAPTTNQYRVVIVG